MLISVKGISMILDRSRKGRLVVCAVAVIGLCALGAGVANSTGSPAETAPDSGQQAVGSSERLRELMTERYEILRSIVESLEKLLAAGRMTLSEWRNARVALYVAQADLCADTAERIKVYEEMVDFLRDAEQLARRRAASGQMTGAEVLQARLATIEAQMALERLRLGQT